jgi:hypothetical protein
MRAKEFTPGGQDLIIFDIDDTLMHTTAKIKVVKDGQIVRDLTNQEFNTYKLQPGEEFDFGEFRNAEKFRQESKPIEPMVRKLKTILNNAGNAKVIMLTARADFDDKDTFLQTFQDLGIDMSKIHVHRAGNLPGNDSPAYKKAVWVRKYLDTKQYSHVRLYDDSMSNLRVFKELQQEYPTVDFRAVYVGPGGTTQTVEEAAASDAELKQRYGDFEPEDKPMLPTTQVKGAPAPTLWSAYETIQKILGRGRVTDNEDDIQPGMYYVYQSNEPPMFRDTEESGPGGSINVPNLESRAARDVAMAAHEACHAYVHDKTKGAGRVHANEKIINNLAEKWLRKHLTGSALHVALETIIGSRVSYGKDHIPPGPVTDMRENFADGKNPQDKGDSKRHGINTKASVSSLRKTAKQGGRKGQLAHWLANMKAGRAKKNK